jgi:hypothetical protein
MLPLAPDLAPGQRRGIGPRATFPSPIGEASAGLSLAPQVVLSRSSKRVSTRLSLTALVGSFRSCGVWFRSSIFLHPFAPRTLLRFHTTMDALTPTAAGLGGQSANRPVLVRSRSPCFTCWIFRPFRLQPPVDARTDRSAFIGAAYRVTPVRGPMHPRSSGTDRHLGFAFRLKARHVHRPNRVRLLRTGRSPPVAPHPASRRRSYLRLQCPDRASTGTFTLRVPHARRRTAEPRQGL